AHTPIRPLTLLAMLCGVAGMAVRPKLSQCRPGPNLQPPERIDADAAPGPRDVVVKLYDISTPELCRAMSLLASKPVAVSTGSTHSETKISEFVKSNEVKAIPICVHEPAIWLSR
ncbi:MAG: hypothetical protein EBV58_08650, partial [Actinobacteria bacterium]|nr:hypothetical protein [Actinomycetota bacterium]